jgi:hypothetical protein
MMLAQHQRQPMLGITTEEEEPNEVDYSYRKNHKMMKIADLN